MRDSGIEDICYGRHPVIALLEESPHRCHKILISEGINKKLVDDIYDRARKNGIPVLKVDNKTLDRVSGGASHQGVLAYISQGNLGDINQLIDRITEKKDNSLVVVADKIKDPNNLGAIIRSAEVFGVLGVIFPKRNSAYPSSAVHKSSAGASMRVMMVSVSNLVSAIKRLQENGMWVVGLDQRADRYLWDEPSIRGKLTLVVGSEEAGISPIVARACDDIRSIPMFGKTGSLNAAVAASIGMYEWMESVVKGGEGRDG